MSSNAAKIGGGLVVGVLAIGGAIAKNADNLFRAGARNARHLDGAATHIDDIGRVGGRQLDEGFDVGRRVGIEADPSATRLVDGAEGASDADSIVGDVVQEGVGAAADAAEIITNDDE